MRLLLIPAALLFVLLLGGCSEQTLDLLSQGSHKKNEATVLIAVEGYGKRAVRHIVISTKEKPEGYAIYFHDSQPTDALLAFTLPAPSHDVRLKEYSLTGYYGCSRGKRGYGYGGETIPLVIQDQSYFLGTINTAMNTAYREIPDKFVKEARERYGYKGTPKSAKDAWRFQSRINIHIDMK